MNRSLVHGIIALMILLGLSLMIAFQINGFLGLAMQDKELPDVTLPAHNADPTQPAPDGSGKARPLRIADFGSVGVIPDAENWCNDYSHNLRHLELKKRIKPLFAYARQPAVKSMLNAILDVAERFDKLVVFRTWSVGVGQIGDMHTNPQTYATILGDIVSDRLIVSTKYCNGNFYSYIPLNRTLYQGSHKRLVEFQARREFEGFNAFPLFLGPLYQKALLSFLEQNRNIEGICLTGTGFLLHGLMRKTISKKGRI